MKATPVLHNGTIYQGIGNGEFQAIEEDGGVGVSGTIVDINGTPSTNDTVFLGNRSASASTQTDVNGSFTVRSVPRAYDVRFYQIDWESGAKAYPNDNVPDVYALGSTSPSTGSDVNFGQTELPAAHPVTLTVNASDGDPISNATVGIYHQNNGGKAMLTDLSTGTDGMLKHPDFNKQSIDLTGDVSISVSTPNGANATRTVTIDSSTNLTITPQSGGKSDNEPRALKDSFNPPTDLGQDGLYEDINGDGQRDVFDVQALFNNLDSDIVQNNSEEFNFSGGDSEEITIFDVQALFRSL